MRRSLALTLLGSSLALGCADSSSDSTFLTPGVTDLGIAGGDYRLEDGVLAASRSEDGVDRNGDGDGVDRVLEIVDLRGGRRTFVANESGLGLSVGAGFVAFLVSEQDGGRDLNGDHDLLDFVLHVHDTRTGRTRNLGHACFDAPAQDGDRIAVAVFENAQGEDLDGDGDLDDSIPFVYEAERQRLTQLPGTARSGTLRVVGRHVLWQPDDVDTVQVYDALTGRIHDTARACDEVRLEGSLLAMLVPEWENGDFDLNGNGRSDDSFVELHDLDTGRVRVTSQNDSTLLALDGDLAVVALEDPFQPREIRVYDRLDDRWYPLPSWGSSLFDTTLLSARRHAFLVNELEVGADLDGDGELFDDVLHLFDARTGRTRAVRAAYSSPALDERWLAFLGLSEPQVARPPTHTSVHVLDVQSGVVRDLEWMASDFRLEHGRILALTPEAWQGVDLDGDQRLDHSVLLIHDLGKRRTYNTGLARFDLGDEFHPVEFDGEQLVLEVGGRLKALHVP